MIGFKNIEFAILFSDMNANSKILRHHSMKCQLCGEEHDPGQECGPGVDIDLPQFEAPKFDLPDTGPLDSDEVSYHLPRYKPPIFDLLRSNIPSAINNPDESNS